MTTGFELFTSFSTNLEITEKCALSSFEEPNYILNLITFHIKYAYV